MKADFSRVTHKPEKHYRQVRFEQGKIPVEAELNESQDLALQRIETETQDVIGAVGVPLDNPGFRGAATLQGAYNDLSESTDPRATFTLSTTNKAETVGFLVSAAYTERTSWQDGFGTVRWAQPDRDFAGNETDLSDEDLHDLWYPRLPRQDSFRHFQERLGLNRARHRPSPENQRRRAARHRRRRQNSTYAAFPQ